MKKKHKVVLTAQTNGKPIRIRFKPGRNEVCECGSGLKYKKCCGHKESLKIQALFMSAHQMTDELMD